MSWEPLPGVQEIFVPPAPGSLMRSHLMTRPGKYRLARGPCELYSVEIMNPGAWPRYLLRDNAGRIAWYEPSAFTGSFIHGGGMDGLVVEIHASSPCQCVINFREPTRDVA